MSAIETVAAQRQRIAELEARAEQRERKVERLIDAGESLKSLVDTTTGKFLPNELYAWDEAVAALQADSPPPIARDPIPDTGGKIKW